jgi:hypothetical protein
MAFAGGLPALARVGRVVNKSTKDERRRWGEGGEFWSDMMQDRWRLEGFECVTTEKVCRPLWIFGHDCKTGCVDRQRARGHVIV